MFSHTINNPNNFLIKKDDYNVIPLFPNKIQKVLENNFDGFIPAVYNGIFYNKYDFRLEHFNNNINNGVEEYKRRIDRFNDVIHHPKKIYFVYINEDYLYDQNYRNDEFNHNIFNQMLDLEKFLKNKYINIDYNILYFNFKEHNIPTDSNIINIVLHSTTLYDTHDSCPFNPFRNYCGTILTELFYTKLTLGYNVNDFNN